jgi:hypothetical protein
MTGCVAIIPKDRNHSLSSGMHASPCSSSARSTNAMPLRYRPRRHRIRPPRGPRAASPARISHQHLVTPHLLEAIKEACKDHSKETGNTSSETLTSTRKHTSTRLSWTLRGIWKGHMRTHFIHTLRCGSPSLSRFRL